jgi:serine/threonine protein kinase
MNALPRPIGDGSARVGPGDVLRQKYRLEQCIGQGGMAVVFAATHLHLQQRVAIKLLKPESPREPEVLERFLREARAASRLEDPHVARVLDVDAIEDGTPFLVMEHLEGCDLAQLVHQRALAIPEAVGYVREACQAIAEAHALGIIHRDVKPANLFLARRRSGDPIIKVLDFGISKLLEDTRITEQQVGMGSAEYMSPEQMRSAADVDGRTDVWSLGVTLYELCTGRTPFHAEGVGAVIAAVMAAAPIPPRQHRPDLPPGLDAVILRCLEKDPQRRFASVEELSAALAPFAGASVAMLAPAPHRASLPSAPALPQAKPASPPAWKSPLAGVAAGIVALIVVIVAFGVGRGSGGPAPERYKLEADTLLDTQTKRTWQRRPAAGSMDLAGARAHCARLGGGYRLPSLAELQGLFAVTLTDPPLDPVSFPTSAIDVYWTSAESGPGMAWVVHFSTGRSTETPVTSRNRVRCVR